MSSTPHHRAAAIKSFAAELGFQLAGVSRPDTSAFPEEYGAWLAAGKHGEMAYLGRDLNERLDARQKFPWARSILSVALSYHHDMPAVPDEAANALVGKIARYAWGRDYHKVIEAKLRKLERRIRAAFPEETIECRAYADAGPLLEREIAARAGLGWVGKNTLLIHPRHGSWFVLGELVLSLELEPDSPLPNHCGTCTRCIDACPTHAITPYSLDARACISYLTLEHRAGISDEYHGPMREAGFLIGCDICQEVCPFNSEGRPLPATDPDLTPRPPAPAVPLHEVLAWQEQEWDILTRGRAGRRSKFEMWKRNAAILAGITPAAKA